MVTLKRDSILQIFWSLPCRYCFKEKNNPVKLLVIFCLTFMSAIQSFFFFFHHSVSSLLVVFCQCSNQYFKQSLEYKLVELNRKKKREKLILIAQQIAKECYPYCIIQADMQFSKSFFFPLSIFLEPGHSSCWASDFSAIHCRSK